jgi:hypothetical protein
MSYMNYLNKLSSIEKLLCTLFIIYIVLPIDSPDFIANMVDSPLGMASLFGTVVLLFCYTNPMVAILYIFVSYELLRRSSNATGKTAIVEHTPTQKNKDIKMEKMNPPKKETLEEEMVEKLAPVGHSDLSVYSTSSYSPVYENIGSASVI